MNALYFGEREHERERRKIMNDSHSVDKPFDYIVSESVRETLDEVAQHSKICWVPYKESSVAFTNKFITYRPLKKGPYDFTVNPIINLTLRSLISDVPRWIFKLRDSNES